MSLIFSFVFSLADSPFRRKLESAIQSSLVDTNSSQNSSGEHWVTYFFFVRECVFVWIVSALTAKSIFGSLRWKLRSRVEDVKRSLWPTLILLLKCKTWAPKLYYYIVFCFQTIKVEALWIPCYITSGSDSSCHIMAVTQE